MGSAKCNQCGHTFEVRILEDDWTTNSFVYEPDTCPECNSEDTQFQEYDDESDFFPY